MPIANCKRCGRIYNRVRRDICNACIEEEDKAFLSVRGYLREHPELDMNQLCNATSVDAAMVVELIQSGRLILRDNPNMTYSCERCGQPTQTGRYCSSCARELSAALESASNKIRENAKNTAGDRGKGFHSR